MTDLTADDYSYHLPDHWILDTENATNHFPIVHDAYVGRVVEIIVNEGAHSVIEVGCGDGWNCSKLVQAGLDVAGVDWSKNAIFYATHLVPQARFFCGDLRSAGFREKFSQPFDAAIFVEVLEHIPPAGCVEALRNIAATLKDGGTLVLTTPSVNQINTNPQHYRHFDEKTLRDLIDSVGGLTIIAIEGYGDVPYLNRMYGKLRWFENRFYSIKHVRKLILKKYRDFCKNSPLTHCEGFIVTIRKSA